MFGFLVLPSAFEGPANCHLRAKCSIDSQSEESSAGQGCFRPRSSDRCSIVILLSSARRRATIASFVALSLLPSSAAMIAIASCRALMRSRSRKICGGAARSHGVTSFIQNFDISNNHTGEELPECREVTAQTSGIQTRGYPETLTDIAKR